MKHWPFTVIDVGGRPKLQVDYKNETKTFTPEEVSSMVLTKMKETAEAYLGQVPAYFFANKLNKGKCCGSVFGFSFVASRFLDPFVDPYLRFSASRVLIWLRY